LWFDWHYGIQHNDIQHKGLNLGSSINDIQHNDTQQKGFNLGNSIRDIQNNDTQQKGLNLEHSAERTFSVNDTQHTL
jgi:hypothetical protein